MHNINSLPTYTHIMIEIFLFRVFLFLFLHISTILFTIIAQKQKNVQDAYIDIFAWYQQS